MATNVWDEFPQVSEEFKKWLRFTALSLSYFTHYLPAAVGAMNTHRIEHMRQFENAKNPWQLLGVNEVIKAEQRGDMHVSLAHGEARRHGLDADRFRILQSLAHRRPELDLAIELFRRGTITSAQAKETLKGEAWDPAWIDRILSLSRRLPNSQELLTWLVRDVFSDTTRSTLRLDDDFPESAVPQFERLGYDREYVENTWAAHWALPSVSLSFEMLHRELITEEQLDQILVAADILPTFRQAIKDAAYSPLTRVDARRMHDFKVLDDEELKQAYKDIGYNETNATRLMEWTKLYNEKNDDAADASDTKALTRAQILRLYDKGLLSRADTLSSLRQIGYNDSTVAVLVLGRDLDALERAQDTTLEVVRRRYRNNQITWDDAVAQIAATGIEGDALQLEIAKLGANETEEPEEPSESQLSKMLKQGILHPAEYLVLLRKRGYSIVWSSNLLESNGPGSTSSQARPGGRLDITGGYDQDRYGVAEWARLMAEAGYPPEWIEHFMAFLEGNAFDTTEDQDDTEETDNETGNAEGPGTDDEGG